MPLPNKEKYRMSPEEMLDKLEQSPEFKRLINKRLRMCFALSGIIISYFTAFYLCMAFLPGFMGTRVAATSVITAGLLFALSSLLLSVIVSGIYVWWTATCFDPIKTKIIKELRDGHVA